MQVSVVIPARNAAQTLAETLDSLLQQTFTDWEALVVDDGSTDQTVEVVERYAASDRRFSLLPEAGVGAAGARNAGISAAQYRYLLFLDADDWLLPSHLDRLISALREDSLLDVAVCGWAHVTPAREFVFEQRDGDCGDLFKAHAQYCYSLIHTYLLDRAVVEEAGGFDTDFETCEDWDLFQRIARAGARFGRVADILAAYRMRGGSTSSDGLRLLRDGLRVLRNGHGPDPRVSEAHPIYPTGLAVTALPEHAWGHACTCAGYQLGAGEDAVPLLEILTDMPPTTLRPDDAASALFVHSMVAAARPKSEWSVVWEQMHSRRRQFLAALETRLGQKRLASSVESFADGLLWRILGRPGKVPVAARMLSTSRSAERGLRNVAKSLRSAAVATIRATPILERPLLHIKRSTKRYLQLPNTETDIDFEARFRQQQDPWDCGNRYEADKAAQTLGFLPAGRIENALEVGCAEGHMSLHLAARVKHLLAMDISATALRRAAERCAFVGNVEFWQVDAFAKPLERPFDLIVCSEILYYCRDRKMLREVARRLTDTIRMGGYLLLAHGNQIIDDPSKTGFDWGHAFGSQVIDEVFSGMSDLRLVRDGHAPLYRIQLFQRGGAEIGRPEPEPLGMADPLPSSVARQVRHGTSSELPVLLYPSIGFGAGRVSPALFAQHMDGLKDAGFRTCSLEEWRRARDYGSPLAGRAVHIVLDDAVSVLEHGVRSVLEPHGYTGTVIVTVDPLRRRVMLAAATDRPGPTVWRSVRRLQAHGMTFGLRLPAAMWSRSETPHPISHLVQSARTMLSRDLAEPISALRVPDGDRWAWRRRWMASLSGFDFALGSRIAVARSSDCLLALPVIRISPATSRGALMSALQAKAERAIA